MKKYICRMWTKRHNEWSSEFETFENKFEAVEAGTVHVSLIGLEDQERSFEIIEKGVK